MTLVYSWMPQVWKLLASSPLYHVNNDCKSWSFFVCVQNFVHFLVHFCVCESKMPSCFSFISSNTALYSENRYCLLCFERVGLWYLKSYGVCRYKFSISSWSALWITHVLLVNFVSQVLTVVFKLISSLFEKLLMSFFHATNFSLKKWTKFRGSD
jgi:hypothetical protein